MKKTKQLLSVVLALLMIATGIPFVYASEMTDVSTDSESTVSGENGLDLIIENLTEEKETEETYSGGFNILDLTVENGTAYVNVNVADVCTLVVAVYDENSSDMLFSANEQLTASVFTEEDRNDIISIDFSNAVLPEHFLIKAFLLDENNMALCKNYVCRTYTTAYEVFKATTPADFEGKEIVTLDENCDDFGVLADDVIVGEKSDTMTYTYSDGVFAFFDASEEVKNLAVGDVFYYRTGDEISDFLLIKVKEIHVDGTTVSITEDDEIALDDAFQFFRIDAKADFSDVELTDDNLGDALSPVEQTEPLRVGANSRAIDVTKEESWSTKVSVDYPPEKDNDDPYVSEFKATGEISYTIKAGISIYYDARFGDDFYEFATELTHTVGFNVTFTGKVECNKKAFGLEVPDIPLGPFLTLNITVYPVMSVEAAVTFGGSCDIYNRLSYTDTNGLTKTNDTKWWDLDGDFGKTEVTVKFGLGVEFDVGFKKGKEDKDGLSTIHASVSVAAELGLEGTFTPSLVGVLLDEQHDCVFCLAGQLSVFVNGTATLKIKIVSNSLKFKWDAVDLTFKVLIGDCYFSIAKNGVKFGFGPCPNKRYKVTVTVSDINGNPVEGAIVSTTTGHCDANGDDDFNETSMLTDVSGQAVFYFPKGKHEITAKKDNVGISGEQFEILAIEKDINLVLFDAVYFNGHFYKLYNVGSVSTYSQAQAYCANMGGYLAIIGSQAENSFLYEYIKSCGFKSAYFGLTDEAKEGTWMNVDGTPVSYTNWAQGEPNNESNEEDYGMFYYKYTSGQWNDGNFGHGTVGGDRSFICEWSDLPVVQNTLKSRILTTGLNDDKQEIPSVIVDGTTATFADAVNNTEYVLTVIKDETAEDLLSSDNLLYIDQQTAESSTVSFEFVIPEGATNYTVRIFGACQSAPTVQLGDLDGNGKIESADARLALRAAVKLETLTEEQMTLADVDKDGLVTASDARLILRYAVGLKAF